jgi:ASC-1-like (ASCH) protein
MKQISSDRLFVPLSADPYKWFSDGKKRWELRRYGRQYTEKHVWVNRRVELRHGYSDPSRSIWGTIVDVHSDDNLKDFFDKVPYNQVIPVANNLDEAIAISEEILKLPSDGSVPLLAFEVAIDDDNYSSH